MNIAVALTTFIFIFCSPSSARSFNDTRRIVGGIQIDIRAAPFAVCVYKHGEHKCGGSIITKDFVLSAAHCK
jgi:secreted trypsin-like serine protease